MSAAAFRRPPQDATLTRMLSYSFGAHVLVLVLLSLSFSMSIRTLPPAAPMQVRLVGVPQPAAPKAQPEPQQVRTQDSAAPKEPPPEAKNIPPSDAKTKFLQEVKEKPTPDKPNPIEAKERPPVLDKNPDLKKVVKNDKNAKVVKNPEDFMASLDNFVDKNAKATPKASKAPAVPNKPAGEGPQIQLNMAEQGMVDGIRNKIMKEWYTPSIVTKGLSIRVLVSVLPDGNLAAISITRGSGNNAFDASLVRAIRKAAPLPIPADKYSKFQELDLEFVSPN